MTDKERLKKCFSFHFCSYIIILQKLLFFTKIKKILTTKPWKQPSGKKIGRQMLNENISIASTKIDLFIYEGTATNKYDLQKKSKKTFSNRNSIANQVI